MAQCQIPGKIQEDSRMASSKIQDLMGDEGACMSTLSGRAQVVWQALERCARVTEVDQVEDDTTFVGCPISTIVSVKNKALP
jgi:hypothetical protein